jgi:hypothetical protein
MTYTPVFAVKYTLWKFGRMEYCKISNWGTLQ